MNVILLPQGVVWLLNCLYHNEDITEALEAYAMDRAGAQEWLDRECAFQSDQEEAAELETLQYLWKQVDAQLEREELNRTELSELFFEAGAVMEKLDKRRSRGTYSPQPAINRLLMVGAAYLREGASNECLMEYTELAADYHSFISGMYRAWRLDLPEEMRPPTEEGFSHIKEGIADLKSALQSDSTEEVEQALALVKAGSELVQFLLDRVEAQDRLTEEENTSLKIPIIGAELESQVKAAREVEREAWQGAVDNTLEDLLPILRTHWHRISPALLIAQPQKDQLVEQLEDALDQVHYVYENAMESEYSTEDVAEGLADAVQDLSDSFAAIDQASLNVDGVEGTLDGLYVKLCRGLMCMEAPDLALENLLREHPPAAGLDCFQAYLQDRARPHLVEGLRLMLAARPAAAKTAPGSGWTG